jgi:CheY-like chemotaxis protein
MDVVYRVLVVDDEESQRLMIIRSLEGDGHQVVMVHNGKQALRSLARQDFDLIITGIVMPEMDGIELLRALRHRQAKPRVIVIAGDQIGSVSYLSIARILGADATLSKPVLPSALKKEIERVMGAI